MNLKIIFSSLFAISIVAITSFLKKEVKMNKIAIIDFQDHNPVEPN